MPKDTIEKAVKKGKPWTVMCAYNKVNGTYCCEHEYLMTDILKEEAGKVFYFYRAVILFADFGQFQVHFFSHAGVFVEFMGGLGQNSGTGSADCDQVGANFLGLGQDSR